MNDDTYPIKIRWLNSSKSLHLLTTRLLESLDLDDPRIDDLSSDEAKTACDCLINRQKTNVVIQNKDEADAVLKVLRAHKNGLGHPVYGSTEASTKTHKALCDRIEKIETA